MKKFNIYILGLVAWLYSCSSANDKADAYGNFETIETMVGAEAQGKLLTFTLDEGVQLSAGQVVGVIDTTALWLKKQQLVAMKKASEAKLAQIKAQIDVQETQKVTIEKEKNRVENLVKDKAAPAKQLDDVVGQFNLINSQIASIASQRLAVTSEAESIEQQIKQTDDQIAKSYIKNPINGRVLEKYIEPAEIASVGKNLYKIANLDVMKLKVYISGAQLPAVKLGQKVRVRIDAGDKDYKDLEGVVTWISSQAEFTPKIIQTKEERVKQVYAVKIDVKNDGSIKIGMPGEVFFSATK